MTNPDRPVVSGTKWLRFWTYVGLPFGGIVAFLTFFDLPRFRYEIFPLAILFVGVAYGLHRRSLWAWQWNWIAVVVVFVAMLVPAPIREAHGGFVDLVSRAVIGVAAIDWTHDSLGDLVLPLAIRLVLGGLFWFWPNWVYWMKREHLFS